jgi:hypothetical protein
MGISYQEILYPQKYIYSHPLSSGPGIVDLRGRHSSVGKMSPIVSVSQRAAPASLMSKNLNGPHRGAKDKRLGRFPFPVDRELPIAQREHETVETTVQCRVAVFGISTSSADGSNHTHYVHYLNLFHFFLVKQPQQLAVGIEKVIDPLMLDTLNTMLGDEPTQQEDQAGGNPYSLETVPRVEDRWHHRSTSLNKTCRSS